MTEEQIINRYVRGWLSLKEYRAALVEFYNSEDRKEQTMTQGKIILRDFADNVHAHGIVETEKYTKATIVRWAERYFTYNTFTMEKGVMMLYYDEAPQPLHITEF